MASTVALAASVCDSAALAAAVDSASVTIFNFCSVSAAVVTYLLYAVRAFLRDLSLILSTFISLPAANFFFWLSLNLLPNFFLIALAFLLTLSSARFLAFSCALRFFLVSSQALLLISAACFVCVTF